MFGSCPIAPTGGWGSQKPPLGVGVNWSHPLSRGLVLFQDLPNRVDFARGRKPTVISCENLNTPLGAATQFTKGDSLYYLADTPELRPDAWTITACVRVTDTIQGFSAWSNFLPAVSFDWWGTTRPIIYLGSGCLRYFSTSAWDLIKNGQYHVVSFAVPGPLTADVLGSEMWIDGTSQSVYSTATTGAPASKGQLRIGGSAVPYSFGGNVLWFALHNRHLQASEIRQFHARPYRMFEAGTPLTGVSRSRRLIDGSLASSTPLLGAVA